MADFCILKQHGFISEVNTFRNRITRISSTLLIRLKWFLCESGMALLKWWVVTLNLNESLNVLVVIAEDSGSPSRRASVPVVVRFTRYY